MRYTLLDSQEEAEIHSSVSNGIRIRGIDQCYAIAGAVLHLLHLLRPSL
jgi:hypothetical protein